MFENSTRNIQLLVTVDKNFNRRSLFSIRSGYRSENGPVQTEFIEKSSDSSLLERLGPYFLKLESINEVVQDLLKETVAALFFETTLTLNIIEKTIQIDGKPQQVVDYYAGTFFDLVELEKKKLIFERNFAQATKVESELPVLFQCILDNLECSIREGLIRRLEKKTESVEFRPYSLYLPAGHGGMLIHEVIGHLLEFRPNGFLNERFDINIGPSFLTVVDDPTLDRQFGSFDYDDEGRPGKRKVLIQNGVIKDQLATLQDREFYSNLSGGNARSSDFRFNPKARMSNTFLEPNPSDRIKFKNLVDRAEMEVVQFGQGKVNHQNGNFEFLVREAWLLGSTEEVLLSPFIIKGNALDLLRNFASVAGETKLVPSYCLSSSGSIPVSYGQPDLLVHSVLCQPLKGA